MPLMIWNDSLDIGVDQMNLEHREILDAMNKIFDQNAAGVTGLTINNLVNQLGAICERHFADEEAYMAQIAYPGLSVHKHLHTTLLSKYAGFAEQIRTNGGRVDEEFLKFLKFWLTSHIKGVDTKYSHHAHTAAA